MGAFDDLPSAGAFDDLPAARGRAGIGQPEELTLAEKFAARFLPQSLGDAPNLRGTLPYRVAQGMADPVVGAVQLGANLVGAGDGVNSRIAEVERQYQDARNAIGSEGFDAARMVGNIGATAPLGPLGGAARGVLGMAARGAVQGAVGSALQPVTNAGETTLSDLVTGNEKDNFWTAKGEQVMTGAGVGAVAGPLAGALARIVSPKASVNPNVRLLREEGIRPTVGQAAGGAMNTLEEKLQSVPILGDAIRSARGRALRDFNEAAINRSTAPVGRSVKGSGQQAVSEAGDILSDAYESAISKIKGVNFDTPDFNASLANLQRLAGGLEPAHGSRFHKTLNDVVIGRMSPNGSMLGDTFKKVDSELGQLAARYGKSPMAGEQELADAVKELQRILREQVAKSSPEFSQAVKAADKGWANLVRVENAAGRAANNEGVFTPGQLNMAVRGTDRSVRGRATARGDALMQDLANAGQQVIGNKYPDSGTAGRLLSGVGAIGSAAIHPAIPAALMAGAAAYAPPIQNFLVYLLTQRPDLAPRAAEIVRRLSGPSAVGGAVLATGN